MSVREFNSVLVERVEYRRPRPLVTVRLDDARLAVGWWPFGRPVPRVGDRVTFRAVLDTVGREYRFKYPSRTWVEPRSTE